jgi:hypothetical protein
MGIGGDEEDLTQEDGHSRGGLEFVPGEDVVLVTVRAPGASEAANEENGNSCRGHQGDQAAACHKPMN